MKRKINIGINGFGRIGRIASRIILNRQDLTLKAVNSRADASSHAYLLKYDSTYGVCQNEIKAINGDLVIDGNQVKVFNYSSPSEIPWDEADVDIVIDSTGKFRKMPDLAGHLTSNVKTVILSSPAKDDMPTFIIGVNSDNYKPLSDRIISNSSCTTNCLATTLKVLSDKFGIRKAFMTTVHAVTDSQNLLDNSHTKEIRLRRAAFSSIIPAKTGSAGDIVKLFPELSGKIVCQAIRVPLPSVSMIILSAILGKKTDTDTVNKVFIEASKHNLKNILAVSKDELVSADYTGSPFSSIVDTFLTRMIDNDCVNVSAWYDNEWGYASRLIDLTELAGRKNKII